MCIRGGLQWPDTCACRPVSRGRRVAGADVCCHWISIRAIQVPGPPQKCSSITGNDGFRPYLVLTADFPVVFEGRPRWRPARWPRVFSPLGREALPVPAAESRDQIKPGANFSVR